MAEGSRRGSPNSGRLASRIAGGGDGSKEDRLRGRGEQDRNRSLPADVRSSAKAMGRKAGSRASEEGL